MTTAEFIEKALRGTTKKTECSSVFKDIKEGQLRVYSYGWHYPLATIIDGKAFVNTRGYSITTSRHIGWAKRACIAIVGHDNVYDAPLFDRATLDKPGIVSSAEKAIREIAGKMDAKKRTDTAIYLDLRLELERYQSTLSVAKRLA